MPTTTLRTPALSLRAPLLTARATLPALAAMTVRATLPALAAMTALTARAALAAGAVLASMAFPIALAGCGGGGGGQPGSDGAVPWVDGGGGDGGGGGSVLGRLAAPSTDQGKRAGRGLLAGDALPARRSLPPSPVPLSFDEVTVDLLGVEPGTAPESWAVVATAAPDASGAFAFAGLAAGTYALRVNQPEFATIAYGVDSTEFSLGAGETVRLVLPVITTLVHGLADPASAARPGGPPRPALGVDDDTGEIVVAAGLGVAIVDPGRGALDLLFGRDLFHGAAVVALAPQGQVLWLLYADRLVRIDRSIFTDPAASEVLDLDDPATRLALGDRVRARLLSPPLGAGCAYLPGGRTFSPDEGYLYASTGTCGVMAIDLARLAIDRVFLGQTIGYNPASNHLLFVNGQGSGTEVLVVDATTRLEVAVIPLDHVQGAAARPGSPETVLVGAELSTGDALVPFVKVIDGSGAVVVDERARDYLGLAADPAAGAPAFDSTGEYFMLGQAAFRVLPAGGFEPLPAGVEPGPSFRERLASAPARALDPAHLYQLWYGSPGEHASVGLLSLDGTSLPVAVRPSVPATTLALDPTRGRAIFWGVEELVLVHYADPSALGLDERLDLSGLAAPLVADGASCSAANPCPGTDLCAGATDTAYSGRCRDNPRLPFLPLCGGFGGLACDDGFTCQAQNPTNPSSIGHCEGTPYRDYAAHGPACALDGSCPAGLRCGALDRCEPAFCLRDADCAAVPGEICGQVENVGRACLAPGPLPDGTPCLGPEECEHGACVAVQGAWAMGAPELVHGARGLRVCGTPCFQGADCAPGTPCVHGQLGAGYGGGAPGEVVWRTHRVQVLPYCLPAAASAATFAACGDCGEGELCAIRDPDATCQVGLEPIVMSATDGGWTQSACIPPAEPGNYWSGSSCAYGCLRSGDCPYQADCVAGLCSPPWSNNPSPCGGDCAPEQSCAFFGDEGACVASDACDEPADCGGAATCRGACLASCDAAAGCGAGEECVDVGPGPIAERYCLPPACGCTGDLADELVCDRDEGACELPGACTDVPCDGSVLAECDVTAPAPLPLECVCPACAWNAAACPGGTTAPSCPTGFTCAGTGEPPLPAHVGTSCRCASPGCQAP